MPGSSTRSRSGTSDRSPRCSRRPSIVTVLHAGDNDLVQLKRRGLRVLRALRHVHRRALPRRQSPRPGRLARDVPRRRAAAIAPARRLVAPPAVRGSAALRGVGRAASVRAQGPVDGGARAGGAARVGPGGMRGPRSPARGRARRGPATRSRGLKVRATCRRRISRSCASSTSSASSSPARWIARRSRSSPKRRWSGWLRLLRTIRRRSR